MNIEEKDNSDEEEELRDVIDQRIISGNGFNKNNSPFASVNQSLKNVEEKKVKKVNFEPESSSVHFIEVPNGLELFAQMRSSQKRTNTFESFDSSSMS